MVIRIRYPETQAEAYAWIFVGIVLIVIFGTLIQPQEPTSPKPELYRFGNENGINAK